MPATTADETPLLARAPPRRSPYWPETRLLRHVLRAITVNLFNRKSALPKAWRVELSIPFTSYSSSCTTYTFTGLHAFAMFTFCPESLPTYPQRTALIESLLVALQGYWSYMSDVDGVGMETYIHCVDRTSALMLIGWQFYKWGVLLAPTLTEGEKCWLWIFLSVGMFAKLRGYRAVMDGDLLAFRFWHIMWHLWLPLAILAFHQQRWHHCSYCSYL